MKTFKFLLFDELVVQKTHIVKIDDKCEKVLNIMKRLTGTACEAEKCTLTNIYIALIRSVLDYGFIAFGSAACTS